MPQHKISGNGLLISLGIILSALILAIILFFYIHQRNTETMPVLVPNEISVQTTGIVTTTTAPTVATQAQIPETEATEIPTTNQEPIGWPEVTAFDGRDNLGLPYQLNGLTLVNRVHPVNWDFVPPVNNREGVLLQPVALDAYFAMREAANADGIDFFFRSGYRSFANQVAIYNQYLRTDPGGKASVDRYSAPPGASEHQTGLAVDIDNGNGLSNEFDQTPAGIWLHENAYKFGFIIRFPKGKEHITGYQYEPWHFRYVGVEIAQQFGPHNTLSLEEYLGAEAAPAP